MTVTQHTLNAWRASLKFPVHFIPLFPERLACHNSYSEVSLCWEPLAIECFYPFFCSGPGSDLQCEGLALVTEHSYSLCSSCTKCK